MEDVNTFSDFNRISIRDKFSPLLKAWYLLRHHNSYKTGGSGWLSHKEALSILSDYYEENRPREIMISGIGTWWVTEGNGYCIASIETISRRLNQMPGDRVEIPIEAFTNLQKFRAHAYATFFARASSEYNNFKGKGISRNALIDLFGISIPTQIKYEKLAKMNVQPRTANEGIPRFDGEYIPEEKALNDYKASHNGYYNLRDIDGDGFLEAVYQMTNLYFVDSVVYKSNENKRVKNIGGFDIRDEASRYKNKRMYFDHPKQHAKIKNKESVHEYSYVYDEKLSKKEGSLIYKKIRN